MKLKKGDRIIVIIGKDKGRKGKIEKIFPKLGKALIPGLNVYKKHAKAKSKGQPGGIIEKVIPLPVSNIALVCPKCGKPTRIGYSFEKGGVKNRICRKCRSLI